MHVINQPAPPLPEDEALASLRLDQALLANGETVRCRWRSLSIRPREAPVPSVSPTMPAASSFT